MSLSTRSSLLRRLDAWHDDEAWRALAARYEEVILRYALARGLQLSDAEDVRQQVLFNLARAGATFRYDRRRGRFRDYLRRITRNVIARRGGCHEAGDAGLEGVEVPGDHDEVWEREWMDHHYRRAAATLRETHDAGTVAVFEALLAGHAVRDVAADAGTSEAAVRKVKQRLRDRFRELIAAQVAEEDEDDG